ncbi:hypothetical protein CDAR_7331 [Caerostris darwini]|uniref:Uncharacterized protein n=1 Tax=Caerostris darwini TaxID=1538125 RepID=A0AAV4USZ8_9ARAC|nr:hypothetical protein CDAR_7331 [Caerostris darwini]
MGTTSANLWANYPPNPTLCVGGRGKNSCKRLCTGVSHMLVPTINLMFLMESSINLIHHITSLLSSCSSGVLLESFRMILIKWSAPFTQNRSCPKGDVRSLEVIPSAHKERDWLICARD